MSQRYEFEVGDEVRVRDWGDLAQEYGMDEDGDIAPQENWACYFDAKMKKFCGLCAVVSEILDDGLLKLSFPGTWKWHPDMLRLAETKEQRENTQAQTSSPVAPSEGWRTTVRIPLTPPVSPAGGWQVAVHPNHLRDSHTTGDVITESAIRDALQMLRHPMARQSWSVT